MATKPRKKGKDTSAKKSVPVARFEIIREEESTPLGESWAKLRRQFAPLVEAGRIALGDAYSTVAQVVLEKKEDLEDQRAEQNALKRRVARQAKRVASPLLLEAGSLKEPHKSATSKTS